MAINRAQLAKELEPGLNALFGMEYSRYENEHAEIFDNETTTERSQGVRKCMRSAKLSVLCQLFHLLTLEMSEASIPIPFE